MEKRVEAMISGNLKFTELQAIMFLIENNMLNAEKKLESFIKHNKLKTKKQINSLIKNLECFAQEVSVYGEGQNREYTLSGLKDIQTQIIDNRKNNGTKLTEEDNIMKEYLFLKLCLDNKNFDAPRTYTNNQLIKLVNLMPITDTVSASIEEEMNIVFKNYYNKQLISYIKRNAKKNIDLRKRSDIKLQTKHLMNEGRIHIDDKYVIKYLEDSATIEMAREFSEKVSHFQDVSEEKFYEILDRIKEIVLSYGFTYQEYIHAIQKLIKVNSKMKTVIQKVKEFLVTEEIDYIFITMKITILKPETVIKITRQEARQAFIDKLIKTTNKRMKKINYTNRTNLVKEFYRLAMFIILNKLNVSGLDEIIEEEKSLIPSKVTEMLQLYYSKDEVSEKAEFENALSTQQKDLTNEQLEQICDIFDIKSDGKVVESVDNRYELEVEIVEVIIPQRKNQQLTKENVKLIPMDAIFENYKETPKNKKSQTSFNILASGFLTKPLNLSVIPYEDYEFSEVPKEVKDKWIREDVEEDRRLGII